MKNGEGLIHAYLLDGTGGGRRLDMVDIEAWTREQGVLWAHFDYTSEDARQWLQNSAGLQDLVADALLVEETRPRATSIDDGLLIALRGINTNPGAEPDDMVAVRLWVDDKRIISTRERVLFSARDIAEQLD
ncbi:MAG: CorA family divalent cation transporter, partial [Thiogranum sp.]